MVEHYQELLQQANKVIIITPIWWNDLPGMLKGFFDKVMKMNFAYRATKTGVKGLLTKIQQLTIITTSTSPTWYLKLFCGNAVKSVFLKASVKQMGIKNTSWLNFGSIGKQSLSKRQAYLSDLSKRLNIMAS
ncbi:NAD(P)H-dependent oxidoreductase [Agrilactobacillus fermenti]|uniref:NAD(P)H-dependent oxidoreductase n=1 Tax=Agrilactobacillus fermenti TaxID=2586909 RepID=UPI002E7C0079|nr:NAD(P)H-dependent oxidoreductase [Agrilactobacillus fermenti]MCD2256385.1 NAD(P)H-dependent oxidoreductase [Agrilactobacillus fermenti]